MSHRSWDSLTVSLRFLERDPLGRMTSLEPDARTVVVFNAAYDTLYAGRDTLVAFDDGRTGDAEPLLLEACGLFGDHAVCEQVTLESSRKRVTSAIEFDFPIDGNLARGRYRVAPKLERPLFASEGWETLDDGRIPPLSATIRVMESEDSGVTLPIRRRTGTFDLTTEPAFRDFRFHLRSAFRDKGAADVGFQLSADWPGGSRPVGMAVRSVVQKSEEEQLAELGDLAEGASRRVIARLTGFLGAGRTYMFLNRWTYRAEARRYEAEIELHWRNVGGGTWHELVGMLEAEEDGSSARFRFLRGNEAAERRWRERIGEDDVVLDRRNGTSGRRDPRR